MRRAAVALLAAGALANVAAPRHTARVRLIPPENLVARVAPPVAASRDLIRLPWKASTARTHRYASTEGTTPPSSRTPAGPSSPAPTTETSAPAVPPPAAARNASPGANAQGEGAAAPGLVVLPHDWHVLAVCESGDQPHNKLNPLYRGWFQIGFSEWAEYHGVGRDPADASPAEQFAVALRLYAARGWEPWRSSSHCTGLR